MKKNYFYLFRIVFINITQFEETALYEKKKKEKQERLNLF